MVEGGTIVALSGFAMLCLGAFQLTLSVLKNLSKSSDACRQEIETLHDRVLSLEADKAELERKVARYKQAGEYWHRRAKKLHSLAKK